MLFNSHQFIFFYLPVTLAGFFVLGGRSRKLAVLWLAAASLAFYAWPNPRLVVLILASITGNYLFGRAIAATRAPASVLGKAVFVAAILANLGLLGYFKYANFFMAAVSELAGTTWAAREIVLPLGISFFTFTQLAFLVDVRRGFAREYDFSNYLLFVTYFPHLIAGPLLHHKQMMPQFEDPAAYRFNVENFNVGLTIFAVGLAKKVLLADQFSLYATPIFDTVAQGGKPMLAEAWVGAVAYSLQLYFDFSGYSDMAIGLSRMFNVRLPLNFDSPYKAPNIIEFWRRWHMTLSAFLRDYVYISLGGNRMGPRRRHANLMATMLIGGLWHGAGWTYVLWGGLHGLYLILNHGWRRLFGSAPATGLRLVLSTCATFGAVVIAWVPFRAESMRSAVDFWSAMAGINRISLPARLEPLLPAGAKPYLAFEGLLPMSAIDPSEAFAALAVGLAIVWLLPNTQQWMSRCEPAWDTGSPVIRLRWKMSRGFGIAIGCLLAATVTMIHRASAFLYYQF